MADLNTTAVRNRVAELTGFPSKHITVTPIYTIGNLHAINVRLMEPYKVTDKSLLLDFGEKLAIKSTHRAKVTDAGEIVEIAPNLPTR